MELVLALTVSIWLFRQPWVNPDNLDNWKKEVLWIRKRTPNLLQRMLAALSNLKSGRGNRKYVKYYRR